MHTVICSLGEGGGRGGGGGGGTQQWTHTDIVWFKKGQASQKY